MNKEATIATDRHLGYLDALRGIAILGVLLVHASVLTRQKGTVWDLAYSGQRGVQLFYIVSAFTLCLSLDSVRQERRPLWNYFIRRFFRIAPLFYVVIGLNLILKHVSRSDSSLRDLGLGDLLLGFFFLNGTRPEAINNVVPGGWSIAVETTFYLLLPFLFRYVNTVRRSLLLFLVSAPLLLKLCAHLGDNAQDFEHRAFFRLFWFPAEFPVFILGMLGYFVWKEHLRGVTSGSIKQREVSLLLLATSLMLYWAGFPISDYRISPSSYMFLPLTLALCLYPWKWLVNGFTRLLGKISYSLYLLHYFIVVLFSHLLSWLDELPSHPVSAHVYEHPGALPVFFVLITGTSIPICIMSWRFVEQPGIRLGRRLISAWEGRGKGETPMVPSLAALEVAGNTPDAQF